MVVAFPGTPNAPDDARDFVHLNVHTEFSLVDGTLRIPALISAAKAMHMPALAMTDHCNMFGLVKFYRAATAAGIKPIAGAHVLVENPDTPGSPWVLGLLCRNREGYLNLSRLLSRMYIEGQTVAGPIAKRSWLKESAQGLFALSAGPFSDVGYLLSRGRYRRAAKALEGWQQLFGERFFIEIQRLEDDPNNQAVQASVELANRTGTPLLASNAVRFLQDEDYDAHEARVCIHTGNILTDNRRPRNYSPSQYLKTGSEMKALFEDIPEALDNSVALAKACNMELRLGTYFLPAFPTPDQQSESDYLREASFAGLDKRLASRGIAKGYSREDYVKRLEYELDIILQMEFPGYFLIVADFIQWAKDNHIPVGPGRGSGAGSLVAYCLDITDLDPLQFALLFERFLNPERVSMPDFDVDFCMDRRDEVIDYVAQAYGRDHVSQIITYGSMAAKAVVRDCGRVLGYGYGFVDSIAKMIPAKVGMTLNAALEDSPELRARIQEEEDVGDVMELARKLEGLKRNAGKHAGGVVIGPTPLTEFAPLFAEASGDSIVTQFDKDDVESVGLVKFDFLGLRTLTIIDWALQAVNARRAKDDLDAIDINKVDMQDGKVFKLLQSAKTTAVFQLESAGMKKLIRELRPDRFDDLVALVALFRPGPLESGMVGTYVDCKHGRQDVVYPHPKLEPILNTTYGVILYQEQVMQIAQVLAGYSLGGADLLRRAMGKKKVEAMAEQREIFMKGAVENDVDPDLARNIFDLMEKFAGYGFNKSHSVAYALLAYQTAWLKTHYPSEFMAAVLSSDMDSTDKIVGFVEDCRALDVTVEPPDINRSYYKFHPADDATILYGLGAIKGAGKAALDNIVAEREANGAYASLSDLCHRIDLQKANKRVLEALIRAGAFDTLESNRALLTAQLPYVLKAADQMVRDRAAGQFGLFGAPETHADIPEISVRPWSDLQRLKGERDTLGLYLTGHPIDGYRDQLEHFTDTGLGDLESCYAARCDERRGPKITVAGMLLTMRRTDRGIFMALDDGAGRLEVSVFGEKILEYQDMITPDAILVVHGEIRLDPYSGGMAMRAETVMDTDTAQAHYARAIRLEIFGPELDLHAFQSALVPYKDPFGRPLWIRYANERANAMLEITEPWNLKPSEACLTALRGLSGVRTVRVEYR